MTRVETIEDFYKKKFGWMPETLRREMGHFNVFRLDPYVGVHAQPIPYKRRDFYKVMLVRGKGRVHYADQIVEVQSQALSFSNPQIPYKWENTDQVSGGLFCIFDRQFFHQFGILSQYSVFQPGGKHLFELNPQQAETVEAIFLKMFKEIESDYLHKYDVLRGLVFELLHYALKMESDAAVDKQVLNAAERIATLFLELLERQFPVDENHRELELRTPADFARQLNIHVNHLNRAVKGSTGKTTSQVIAERILQEARVLLKHSSWNVSEISNALGFTEPTHFNNFFKRHANLSPLKFRNF